MVQVEEVSLAEAAAALESARIVDPRHENTPADIARGGSCMRFVAPEGRCIFVARMRRGVFFVDAAASEGGSGLVAVGLHLAEQSARAAGCKAVAFETNRPGLVRQARKRGYRVTGYIMEKDVS